MCQTQITLPGEQEHVQNIIHFIFVSTHSLADVLSCEDHVAGPTPEATDVPLFLQRKEGLALFDLISAPSTVCRSNVTNNIVEGERQRKTK